LLGELTRGEAGCGPSTLREGATWEQLTGWIGPVIQGWMAYYGRFRQSGLHPLLARINYHVQEWIRAKYRRLRPLKAMKRAWNRITAQMPGLLPHWRWETGAWY
jgi:RNA-directed DNA polymerase